MNTSIPELLSPVGDWDAMVAAVSNGADAVYLGTREFNARANARNFSFDQLGKAIDYCHRGGVKVYLTLNTLVKNHELRRFFDTLSRAYGLGIDAVIIQHLSFLEIIKRNIPDLPVFMSTQTAIGNVAAASLMKGADRVILPRELGLAEVKHIVQSGIKAEVFVHGALCYSYSGLCLFSSFVGDRSGNRGSCAQLCRQRYNGEYPLSTRELCTAGRIPELIESGVAGFKIEGRMRSPLYVAVATRLYRKAIDSYVAGKFTVPLKEWEAIEVVFNRKFTDGLMFGETELVSPERPMNRGALLGTIENGEITLERAVGVGDGVGIWLDKNVTGAIIKGIRKAGSQTNCAAAGERVDLCLGARNGSQVFLTSSTGISLQPDFTVERPPIVVAARSPVLFSLPQAPSRKASRTSLLVKVYSVAEAVESSRAGGDIIFYDIFAPDFPSGPAWHEKAMLGAYLPRILNDDELQKAISLLKERKPRAILAGNLGFLKYRRQFSRPVYLDYNLNAFNDIDVHFFKKWDVTPVLSPELSLREMTEFRDRDAAILCHGDVVLMNTAIDPRTDTLVDEKGSRFRVRKEAGYWQVLNSRPFGIFNDIGSLTAAGFGEFLIDKQGSGPRHVTLYREILGGKPAARKDRKGHTSGHLFRPVT